MNKLKKEKGITLVALIITIVVLLILAAVAIGAVKNSDIIGYAQNAAKGYETEKGKENESIKEAETLLNKYSSGVDNNTPEGVKIVITPEILTLEEGNTTTITATLTGELSGTIEYISSSESIATVDNNGLVTAISEGVATITAKCGENIATCQVTVTKKVEDGVKYYYTESCDILGVAAPAVITIKDLEEGYKQFYIYIKQGDQYVFGGEERWEYNTVVWDQGEVINGICTIKDGDVFSVPYDSAGPVIVNDTAYLLNQNKEPGWKFDLIPINDEIRNIIESSVSM